MSSSCLISPFHWPCHGPQWPQQCYIKRRISDFLLLDFLAESGNIDKTLHKTVSAFSLYPAFLVFYFISLTMLTLFFLTGFIMCYPVTKWWSSSRLLPRTSLTPSLLSRWSHSSSEHYLLPICKLFIDSYLQPRMLLWTLQLYPNPTLCHHFHVMEVPQIYCD